MELRDGAQDEANDGDGCGNTPHAHGRLAVSTMDTDVKVVPMYIIQRNPSGPMSPPSRKHCNHKAKANPPHAPMKYLAAFQKKMAMPPPATPATPEERT